MEEETCLPTGRYEKDGIRGLEDRSRTPKNLPHKIKTDDKDVKRAIEIKKRLKTFSAKRLKEMFKLRYSPNTLHRIFKEEGLVKPRKRKYKVKRDLREEKMIFKPF